MVIKCPKCKKVRIVSGHYSLKERLNKTCRQCFYKKHSGKNIYNWKGSDVGYVALHKWIKKHLPKPNECTTCGARETFSIFKRYGKEIERSNIELSNKSGKYKRAIKDWEWLCRSCHAKVDKKEKNISFVKRGYRTLIPEVVRTVIKLRKVGVLNKEIAKILGVHESSVYKVARENCLLRRNGG